jgi:glycosyltransferase involved in cell wall biosynthesis
MFGLRGLHPDLEIGGFDTAFATIAPALAARGHEVTIYCRASAHSPARRVPRESGVSLVYVPSPGGKNFAAVSSTLLAVLHALVFRRYDVWFFVNVGMGHHAALARLSGRPVVMNVDGLDWTRAKWGPVARTYYRSAARAAVRFCTALVTDARAMQEFYRTHFGRETEMIAYGAEVEASLAPELIGRFGVRPGEYYLIVSRLIPENSLVAMLEGFRRSRTTRKLVVVGGATYEDAFQAELRALAASDDRIAMVGQVTDQEALRELWCNCHAYLHGHSVGGTNPALLRAMGDGSCVLALDTPFNREVLGEAGLYFSTRPEEIASLIDSVDDADLTRLRAAAQERVRAHYSWKTIVDQYEALFCAVVRGKA